MDAKQELIKLYSNKSKHSNYQVLATALKNIVSPDEIQTTTRYEKERLEYLDKNLDFDGKTVLDIGANTGFFSFELLNKGASKVYYVEGNKEHAEFVDIAVQALGAEGRLSVENKYYDFNAYGDDHYDIALLFNVLHHTGDDYGDADVSVEEAKRHIIQQLNNMAGIVDKLVFQLGFNWKGDVSQPLFEHGTKEEQISFVREAVDGVWTIKKIGIAEGSPGHIEYCDLNGENIKRDESLGEFLNRPIFILESRNEKK